MADPMIVHPAGTCAVCDAGDGHDDQPHNCGWRCVVTSPDTAPFTLAYVLTLVGFWFVAVPAGLFVLALLWRLADRAINRSLDRQIARAIGRRQTREVQR